MRQCRGDRRYVTAAHSRSRFPAALFQLYSSDMNSGAPAIGIMGGSGLYQMEGVEDATEQRVDTPFGAPSDALFGGKMHGRPVYFLPRHGRGHRLLPHELNHRANIYALRSLNVRWIICVTAVGSLQEKYAPRDVLLPTQFYDRTSQRAGHSWLEPSVAWARPQRSPRANRATTADLVSPCRSRIAS